MHTTVSSVGKNSSGKMLVTNLSSFVFLTSSKDKLKAVLRVFLKSPHRNRVFPIFPRVSYISPSLSGAC
jgi:hypothetical protein